MRTRSTSSRVRLGEGMGSHRRGRRPERRGTARMPGNPWIFSGSTLPPPGVPAFQGEHNHEILTEIDVPEKVIKDLQQRGILLSRRSIMGAYD